MSVTLTLPWPPSVNTYWRRVGARTLLSRQARTYRLSVTAATHDDAPRGDLWAARLRVTITAHPPDRRKRDLDNLCKGLLDALQHAQVFADDSQIDDLRIVRGPIYPDGRVQVSIEAIP